MNDITYAPTATVELMTRGMDCLVKNMGIVEAAYFIAAIQRERFDYTKWQREYFDSKTKEEMDRELDAYFTSNPHSGDRHKTVQ